MLKIHSGLWWIAASNFMNRGQMMMIVFLPLLMRVVLFTGNEVHGLWRRLATSSAPRIFDDKGFKSRQWYAVFSIHAT
jgi:hypothetical protein